jgi:hypothetical protein
MCYKKITVKDKDNDQDNEDNNSDEENNHEEKTSCPTLY